MPRVILVVVVAQYVVGLDTHGVSPSHRLNVSPDQTFHDRLCITEILREALDRIELFSTVQRILTPVLLVQLHVLLPILRLN